MYFIIPTRTAENPNAASDINQLMLNDEWLKSEVEDLQQKDIQIDIDVSQRVTLATEQTITAVKTFSALPLFNITPSDPGHPTRKQYVDGLDSANVKLTTAQIVTGPKTFGMPIILDINPAAAPFTINSLVKVINLNADLLDEYHASNQILSIPISNGSVNEMLNADLLDGYHIGNALGYNGFAINITSGASGKFGNCAIFGGTSQVYLTSPFLSIVNHTVSFWIKRSENPTLNENIFTLFQDAQNQVMLTLRPTGEISFRHYKTDILSNDLRTVATVCNNQWRHVSLKILNSTQIQFVIDNVEENTLTVDVALSSLTAPTLYIGGVSSEYLNASLDSFIIHSRIINANETTQLFNNNTLAAPLLYYSFNGDLSDTIVDDAGIKIPISNGALNQNLNADKVDGRDVQNVITYSDNHLPTSKAIEDKFGYKVGLERRELDDFVDISPSFPWFCLSKPSVIQTTANYTQEYIDVRRARKWTHERAGASPVSSFGGAWVTNEFTLDNNATNIAFLAELLEDWEFHGNPTTGWRILFDGTTELDITNIVLSTRKITTAANGSGASIEIYTNRVKGSTTSCKHFTEAGLADYQAGGGKIAGALRRDKTQGHRHQEFTYSGNGNGAGWYRSVSTSGGQPVTRDTTDTIRTDTIGNPVTDSINGDPRTGSETQAKSATVYKYLFVGSYEA